MQELGQRNFEAADEWLLLAKNDDRWPGRHFKPSSGKRMGTEKDQAKGDEIIPSLPQWKRIKLMSSNRFLNKMEETPIIMPLDWQNTVPNWEQVRCNHQESDFKVRAGIFNKRNSNWNKG